MSITTRVGRWSRRREAEKEQPGSKPGSKRPKTRNGGAEDYKRVQEMDRRG